MIEKEVVKVTFNNVKRYLELPWNDFDAFVKVTKQNQKEFIRDSYNLNAKEKRIFQTKSFHVLYKPHQYQNHAKIELFGRSWKRRVEALSDCKFESAKQVCIFFQYISNLVETFNLTKIISQDEVPSVEASLPVNFEQEKALLLMTQIPPRIQSRLSEFQFVKNKADTLWKFYFKVLNPKTILDSYGWRTFYTHSIKGVNCCGSISDEIDLYELLHIAQKYDDSFQYSIDSCNRSSRLVTKNHQTYGMITDGSSSIEMSEFSTVDQVLNNIDQASLGYGFQWDPITISSDDYFSRPSLKQFLVVNIEITNLVQKAKNFFIARKSNNKLNDFTKALICCIGHMMSEGCCCAIISNNEEAVIFSLDFSINNPELNTIDRLFEYCHVQYILKDEPIVGLLCATFVDLFQNVVKLGECFGFEGGLRTSLRNHLVTKGYVNSVKSKLDKSRYLFGRSIWLNVFEPHIKKTPTFQLTQIYNCDEKETVQLTNRLNCLRIKILNQACVREEQTMDLVNSKDFFLQEVLRGEAWNVEQTAVTYLAAYESKEGVLKKYDPVRCSTSSGRATFNVDRCRKPNNFLNNMAFIFIREYLNEWAAYTRLTEYYRENRSMDHCDFIPRLYLHGYMFIDKLEHTTKDTLYEDANIQLQQHARSDCPFIFMEKLIPVSFSLSRRLTLEEKRVIKEEAFKSLHAMHDAGVYHNSIKKDNVIIVEKVDYDNSQGSTINESQKRDSSKYQVKFIDFGEARILNNLDDFKPIPIPNLDMGKFENLNVYENVSRSYLAFRDEECLESVMNELLDFRMHSRW